MTPTRLPHGAAYGGIASILATPIARYGQVKLGEFLRGTARPARTKLFISSTHQTMASILTARQVKTIRSLAKKGRSQRDIAWQFGVGRSTVFDVVSGKTWKNVR